MSNIYSRLTPAFRRKVEQSSLTHAAIARGIGVTPQFFNAVWNGTEAVTGRFMAGAIIAGLGKSFSDIAEPVLEAAA